MRYFFEFLPFGDGWSSGLAFPSWASCFGAADLVEAFGATEDWSVIDSAALRTLRHLPYSFLVSGFRRDSLPNFSMDRLRLPHKLLYCGQIGLWGLSGGAGWWFVMVEW